MSGSSLDGLDVCHARFEKTEKWRFDILKASTIPLPAELLMRLRESPTLSQKDLNKLDQDYGNWIGEVLEPFSEKESIELIAVHGHTVYHNPKELISIQIGDGATIAKKCQKPVITDFRIEDIRKGGQGAPLVPVGEYYLFPEYDGFVNLGGIANISVNDGKQVRAWDIAPCNQVLNLLANALGKPYDAGGELARSGSFIPAFYEFLFQKPYLHLPPPKSLGNHWVKQEVLNFLNTVTEMEASDYLHTFVHFLADQLVRDFKSNIRKGSRVLFTGGGAHNTFLMELIRQKAEGHFSVEVPDSGIIDFKEALVFGFLGLLRFRGEDNVFASVTGASGNTSAGTIAYPE